MRGRGAAEKVTGHGFEVGLDGVVESEAEEAKLERARELHDRRRRRCTIAGFFACSFAVSLTPMSSLRSVLGLPLMTLLTNQPQTTHKR